ncbi:MAG: molybdopterin-dependent oxidoreductase, partial [Acidimicrobiia bacterium]|nr:molybdopterin-dependent oxidoreductase [Acidimicrobiia bacterium]
MSERRTHIRTCPLCEATCGLELTVEGDRVVRIRGDRDDVFSRGFICPKGSVLHRLHEDPDRLRRPMIRRGEPTDPDAWTEVSWDEAFAEIASRLLPLLDEHGRDAVAVYLGNPSAHNHAMPTVGSLFLRALGTKNMFSASTVDQMPKHTSSGLLFGSPGAIPVPDIDTTDYLLMLGANPWESNGSLCTAPDFPGRLTALRERGARFVVVDPRRSRTAEEADEHVAIRPGTDAHLLISMLQVLFEEGLVDLGHLRELTSGLAEISTVVAPFTPESVEPVTGVPAATTRRLAREVATAPSAAIYGRIGTHTVPFGTLAAWATDALALVTGNLDRPGGNMFPRAAHARRDPDEPGGRGWTTGRWASRVGGHPEVMNEFPIATLPDEITTPGEGRVRALITMAGNPARSGPHSDRLEQALGELELMVSIDPYLNETTRFADVILPAPSPLERSQYDHAFYGLSVRNTANYSPPLFEPTGLSEEQIVARLAAMVSGLDTDADDLLDTIVRGAVDAEMSRPDSPIADRDVDEIVRALGDRSAPDRLMDLAVRVGTYGDHFGARADGMSFDELEAIEHGV